MNFCVNCQDNNQVCRQCNTGGGFYLRTSTCVAQQTLAAGEGIDSMNGVVMICTVTNCLDCRSDYRMCSRCDTNKGYYWYNGNCTDWQASPEGAGLDTLSMKMIDCSASNCKKCKNEL